MEKEQLTRLVTGAQKGDSDAMNALFTSFYNDVYYFALKTVKDSDVACDITQEAFLEIINTIGSLKEPAAFVTWMKQITYHQCTRYFKKKKDVLVEEDEDGNTIFDTLEDESGDTVPSEVYEKAEFRETILGIINELTEEQRSAVMMYYFDELTVGQIAKIQGVSDGTVKSRLNYSRKAIKKSVESYEKKHGIKLHSVAVLPMFALFFRKEAMPAEKLAKVRAVVSKAASGMGAGASAATGGAAAGVSAKAVVGAGLGAKLAAMPLVTKLVAGVAAAAIAVGGFTAVIGGTSHHCDDADRNCICDDCGNPVHYENPALDHNAFCAVCGASIGIHDKNVDDICDICGEYPCGDYHREPHAYENGICRYCGQEENPHRDIQEDGFCDHCGEAMCALTLAGHRIPEGSCLCELCGEGAHTEGDIHPFCGTCRERLPIDDKDGDGACDVCGEYSCGGSYHDRSHADEDKDDLCDICCKHMCGLVWGLEHNFDYSDGIYDGKCEDCGGSNNPIGWPDDEEETHADTDGNGVCDLCNRNMCAIYGQPNFGGVDADGDEKCDICHFYLCDGHDGFVYHYDFDRDEKCDRCGHYICAHGYLPHTDENGDGKCDKCYGLI